MDFVGLFLDNILDKRDVKGWIIFFNVIKVGDFEEVKCLFSVGLDVNKGDIYRIILFYEVVERLNLEVVEFLIVKGIYY